jgi:cysteine sulfinate desulfinase/cysteine desulfurase-like protein
LDRFIDLEKVKQIKEVKYTLKEGIKRVSESLDIEILDMSAINTSVDHIQSFLLPDGYEAKIVQSKLSESDVYVGTGSACSSQHNRGII